MRSLGARLFSANLYATLDRIHTVRLTRIPEVWIGALVMRQIVRSVAKLDIEVMAIWLTMCISVVF